VVEEEAVELGGGLDLGQPGRGGDGDGGGMARDLQALDVEVAEVLDPPARRRTSSPEADEAKAA
jgi:hypothetical protein